MPAVLAVVLATGKPGKSRQDGGGKRKKHLGKPKCFFCGDRRSRTDDPLLAKQML